HVDYRIMPPYEDDPAKTKQLLGRQGMEVAEDFVDNECLTRFTDKAIDWMSQHLQDNVDSPAPQPFFVYMPMTSPHYPVCPPPEFEGKGNAGAYGEFVLETDYHLGRILSFLDENQISDNTMVIYTSDNGPEKSWKQRVAEFDHRSNGALREGKRSAYEGGHRVPFLVRWPNGIRNPGRQSKYPVCQTDLFATIADLTQSKLADDEGVDSISFANVLRGQPTERRPPMIHHASNGRFAVRDGKWKLLLPDSRTKKYELYDLTSDLAESNDLSQTYPAVVTKLKKMISRLIVNGRSTAGPNQPNDTGYWQDLAWMQPDQYKALTDPQE
ncbi:MAG: sulfatase-like hydrolase/transferase, partial [Planctomycetota bacterium]